MNEEAPESALPLVSIITPSYNQGSFIRETIESVLSQNYNNIEYIVVDGGSTDGTADILGQYGARIRWISEPDQGQADALNKGMAMAKGEIIGWLNSDDTYTPGAIDIVARYFAEHPEAVMVYGEANFIDREGRRAGKYPTEPFRLRRLADTCYICQPTVFLRNKTMMEVGPLNADLHLCLDYDYWIRIGKIYGPEQIHYLRGVYLANSRVYEETKTLRLRDRQYAEAMDILKRHFGFVSNTWMSAYMSEVAIKEDMKKYEGSAWPVRAPMRLYYVTRKFGLRWGVIAAVCNIRHALKP